jgi:hypothetical protein
MPELWRNQRLFVNRNGSSAVTQMLVTEDFEVDLEELWGGAEVEVLDLGWGGGGRWDRRGAPWGAPRGRWPIEQATTSYL